MVTAADKKEPTFHAAWVAALAELGDVTKHRTATVPTKAGGQYSYDYADLSDVLAHVKPILAKHDLAVVQDVVCSSMNTVGVATILVHVSGESHTFGPILMAAGSNPQATGSAITYCRRYSLMAALGIATEDDDGQQAAAQPMRRAAATNLTDEQAELVDAMNKIEPAPVRSAIKSAFVGAFGPPAELKPSEVDKAKAWLEEQMNPETEDRYE